MYLEELINKNYDKLNENDLLIWHYIQANKKQCCDISIEELSDICCISRTTISRFTQKLSFRGFREFKVNLKLEYEKEQVKKDVLVDGICDNFIKSIQAARDTDMSEICSHIYQAKRLFVFGTGEIQSEAAQILKRIFMSVNRFFVTLYGKNEIEMALEDMNEQDLVILISLSGETEHVVAAAKKLKIKGVYMVSITRLSDNTVSRLSQKNLYIKPYILMQKSHTELETTSSYFNLIEILYVKYLLFLQRIGEEPITVEKRIKD